MWRRLRSLGGARDADAVVADPGPGPAIGAELRARRRDRGLSLEDVERDTRINPRYLEALETEDWAALPAPVYARGFMRSYARYLGLDPDAAVDAVPHDLPRPLGLEPLPGLRHPGGGGGPLLPPVDPRMAAIAAGAVVILILAGVFLLPRLRGGGAPPPAATVPAATAPTGVFPPAGATTAPAGATVPPYAPGTVPDFTGVSRVTAEAVLQQLKLRAVPIEAANASVAPGLVFDQSPAPGTVVQENDVVTLFVSKGSGN